VSRRAAIYNTVAGTRVPRTALAKLAKIVLHGERRKQSVILVFIDDRRMSSLNRQFRGKDKTTDVLSFNMNEPDDPLLGEIYISIAEARRNAREYGITPTQEILKLFCHGLLHLCGIHHPTPKKRAAMAAKEDAYLRRLARSR